MPKGKKLLVCQHRVKTVLMQIPSGKLNPFAEAGKRTRMLALTMVRNEARFLPGMLRNVVHQVDGIIALDDGSSDGSDLMLEECPQVLQLLRNRPDRPSYDELGGFKRLATAALDHGAEWIIVIDADERLERDFRIRAERVIRRGRRLGLCAFQVHVRELWNTPDRYRADGIWGLKWAPRLSQALTDQKYDERPLHAAKAPLQGKVLGVFFPLGDLFLYHLRMMRRADRESRRRRYENLDPQARCQPGMGYAYLTDEAGIRLRPVPYNRGYEE
jgi:glycosyltransferase involved in cell wall biosynthesis